MRKSGWFFFIFLVYFLSGCFNNQPTVYTIAVSPSNSNILYIATMEGVYKSRDKGETWEIRSDGLGDAHVISLGIDPTSSSTVYAGTFGDAIYKSQDGGQRWYSANLGLKGHVSVVNAFAFYKKDPKVILAATTIGVFKSMNEGGEWVEKVGGMESVYTVSLVFDPKEDDVLFVGTSGGIYQSADLGDRWMLKNRGLIKNEVGSAMGLGVNSILINPVQNNKITLGTSLGIFQSTDRGETWHKIENGVGSHFVIAVVSNDKDPATLYAGTDHGVYQSVDEGKTWTPKNEGLKNLVIRSLVEDRNDPKTLYAGTQKGLFKTTNGAESWILLKGYSKGAVQSGRGSL